MQSHLLCRFKLCVTPRIQQEPSGNQKTSLINQPTARWSTPKKASSWLTMHSAMAPRRTRELISDRLQARSTKTICSKYITSPCKSSRCSSMPLARTWAAASRISRLGIRGRTTRNSSSKLKRCFLTLRTPRSSVASRSRTSIRRKTCSSAPPTSLANRVHVPSADSPSEDRISRNLD